MANNKPIDKNYLVKQLKNYETEIIDKKYVKQQEGMSLSSNDYTDDEKALVATIGDKVDKSSIATALDDTATDEQVASALLVKTELEKKVNKTSIVTTLSSESTNDEVVGAKLAYDELQKVSSETKEQFATASGDYITVNDSVDGKIRDLKLYGKSEQKQYSGKNLLDCSGLTEQTINGVTFTPVYENGMLQYIKANGTATDDCDFTLTNKSITEDGKTYRIVGCPSGGSSNTYRLSFWGGSSPEYGSGTIFTNEDLNATYKYLYINIVSGYTCNNLVFKPMITTDLEATYDDFEAYCGGIQSPNPDYPQEIKSVVNPVVNVCGKNLCGNLISDKVIDFNSGVLINISGYLTTDYIEVEAGTTYTISNASKGNEKWYYDKDKKPIKYIGIGSQITVTIPDNAKYIRCSTTVELKDLFQIEKGSVATSYESYQETTATLPYTLNAIPVESGGNVTIDGQEYIADYVDFENKKLVRRVKKKDLGEFDWNYVYNVNPKLKYFDTTILDSFKPTASHPIGEGFCDSYSVEKNNIPQSDLANNKVAIGWLNTSSTRCCLEIRDDNYTNALDFKNAVKGRYIYYPLAIQETIDLTDSEVQAFKELSTYYPTTNVFVTSDQLNGYAEIKYPTTDVSGLASKNEAKIAKLAKDTDDKFDDVNESLVRVDKNTIANLCNSKNGNNIIIGQIKANTIYTLFFEQDRETGFNLKLNISDGVNVSYKEISPTYSKTKVICWFSNTYDGNIFFNGWKGVNQRNFMIAEGKFDEWIDYITPTGNSGRLNVDVAELKNDLGGTDISAIGDGTVTGAISAGNESLSSIGKCKNLLNSTFDTYTHNGITFTRNDDGTCSLSGSRTDTSFGAYVTFIDNLPLEKGRYKLTGAVDENNYIRCIIKGSASGNKNIYDYGDGVVLDVNETGTTITLLITSTDDTSQTRIVKPMLTTNLNATYDDFVPYTGDGDTLTHDIAELKKDLGGLSFSASGTTLTITDGTNTWTLGANS